MSMVVQDAAGAPVYCFNIEDHAPITVNELRVRLGSICGFYPGCLSLFIRKYCLDGTGDKILDGEHLQYLQDETDSESDGGSSTDKSDPSLFSEGEAESDPGVPILITVLFNMQNAERLAIIENHYEKRWLRADDLCEFVEDRFLAHPVWSSLHFYCKEVQDFLDKITISVFLEENLDEVEFAREGIMKWLDQGYYCSDAWPTRQVADMI